MSLNISVPQTGQPFATEATKVNNNFTNLASWANGGIAAADLAAAVQQSAGLNGAATVKGAVNIAASESRSNVAYGTLTTPDQVTGLTLASNGLIAVSYQAMWQMSVIDAARAAICLNGTPVVAQSSVGVIAPVIAATNVGTANVNYSLFSWFGGMATRPSGATPSAADVTTGQVVGYVSNNSAAQYEINGVLSGTNTMAAGGPCWIFAAAGTYTVAVMFKSSSGSVTASNRRLWVQALSFA